MVAADRRLETGNRSLLESNKQPAMTSHERQGGNTPRARALANLIPKLSQYTRGSDRRQIIRTLSDPKQLPALHNLQSVWVDDIAAAEREAAGERAVLNGVKFLQVKSASASEVAGDMPVDSYFLQTLREICGHLCDMEGVFADPMALYGGLLNRLSRTVCERDALQLATNYLCGKGELVLLPLQRRHHVNKEGVKCPEPVEVELYVEGGNVHSKVSMKHELGLYKRLDLDLLNLNVTKGYRWNKLVEANNPLALEELNSPSAPNKEALSSASEMRRVQYELVKSDKIKVKPWVFVDAEVVEMINFGSGKSVRTLHLSIPDTKNTGGYVMK
ncbi:hypothetical protein THAOC_31746 [Thalassiosira oceanica]|uniref:Uncharacterized protein n=1 Tax=Thalassiosira oceanica TaxID=159749 RepID=K0RAN5_THAOC|nr:hypothetical protein THAOC_31746 [Thalassiosira oceanica]|mmetsp:Transcript_2051/g.4902  ORF Transcript_2051/g.4902 Transcript_2051/m.4902 type:complete len:331 (-) Transcript_2051:80-1072(-)|eukprot:EJK49384.1 hypothetical protein THAOC_31746 [Thalassiosira oceanica]